MIYECILGLIVIREGSLWVTYTLTPEFTSPRAFKKGYKLYCIVMQQISFQQSFDNLRTLAPNE